MRLRVALSLLLILLCATNSSHAAPKAGLWDRWLPHAPQSTITVDHQSWESFLKQYVHRRKNGVNRLSYAQVSSTDRGVLDSYLTRLEQVPVSKLNREEQRAYWINLYNALTVSVVLAHYPVKSIRDIDISPGLFSDGPWGKKLVTVEGVQVSLDEIEHRILRPIWQTHGSTTRSTAHPLAARISSPRHLHRQTRMRC